MSIHAQVQAAIRGLKLEIDCGTFTERQLGRVASVSQTHTHHILAGKRNPSTVTIDKLIDAAARIRDTRELS